ncbi:NADPH:quinone oxidoreductase family protein [Myxococcaceae bacterium JPH2]|nr:NADPH:quinone oxidoreductase family protein [Myxococcaceae bacterium JPH2]
MKAVQLRRLGGPEELRVEEVATPVPGEGEVLVEVRAAGLNYAELLLRAGQLPGPALPYVPGFEAAGIVSAVGQGVSQVSKGARVAAMLPTQGAFAEYARVPAAQLVPIPESLSFAQATALLSQAPTALMALRDAARLQKGESVFIPSAAGGVGSFLVQFAQRMGAGRVIAGASTAEKREVARRLGADVTVDTSATDWPERIREATGGRGADIVFERGGGEVFTLSLRALAPRGRLVTFGVDSMRGARMTEEQLAGFIFQNQSLVGFATVGLPPEVQAAALRDAMDWVTSGRLEILLGRTFGLEEAAEAHRAMAERRTSGKVVIVPHASAA